MSERDSLLLRWARLKQAAKAAEETDAASARFDATVEPPATDVPFDPTSLPSIESIAADTDVIAFLRAGVPAELTQAALRKVWTSDPAIRDFIGIAENQWDFNDPNAIPGFGPLAPTESGVDILAQISTRLEQPPSTLEELTAAVEPAPANADEQSLHRQLDHRQFASRQSRRGALRDAGNRRRRERARSEWHPKEPASRKCVTALICPVRPN